MPRNTPKFPPCPQCGSTGPRHHNKRNSSGYSSWCAECNNKWTKERHARQPEIKQKYSLDRKYGLSLEEYQEMFDLQKGLCKICGNTETRLLDVDHDHIT